MLVYHSHTFDGMLSYFVDYAIALASPDVHVTVIDSGHCAPSATTASGTGASPSGPTRNGPDPPYCGAHADDYCAAAHCKDDSGVEHDTTPFTTPSSGTTPPPSRRQIVLTHVTAATLATTRSFIADALFGRPHIAVVTTCDDMATAIPGIMRELTRAGSAADLSLCTRHALGPLLAVLATADVVVRAMGEQHLAMVADDVPGRSRGVTAVYPMLCLAAIANPSVVRVLELGQCRVRLLRLLRLLLVSLVAFMVLVAATVGAFAASRSMQSPSCAMLVDA